ncbi:GNAT superfamily N-acetyltransferase [Spirosoma lacussanchae]|uniref:GNAT family N-acetyltransferase n=1 Tax=Spirosoma lacussanchae TaxID=1884249 RepID=UPI0011080738|nr:GNAT family N-acetyltransferase [Spirosoma lacussanchae]
MITDYTISTDKSRLNVPLIREFLSQQSYWAKNIPFDIVERSIANSLCFGVYQHEQQVGFARVITDQATFAYLSDVFILSEHRGKGLSKWLVQTISDWPELQGLRRWMLATRDAHSLYEQFGFRVIDQPDFFMQRKLIETY